MVDIWEQLRELLDDDGLFFEIQSAKIDSTIIETLDDLKFSHIEAKYFQGLLKMDNNPSHELNTYIGGNRTGKSSIINCLAYFLGSEITDLLSHNFDEGIIKATFASITENGTITYNLFNDNTQIIGSESMKNTLKREGEDYKILIWRHKTDIPNFYYRHNKDKTIGLIESSRWKKIIAFLIKQKTDNERKFDYLHSEIEELGNQTSTAIIEEEIKIVDNEIERLNKEISFLAMEVRSSFSMIDEKKELDIESIKRIVINNNLEIKSLIFKRDELEVKLKEYNRLTHMASPDLFLNEYIEKQIIHCPMCNEKLERPAHYCPICGIKKEVENPSNVELLALQECAFKEKEYVKNEINKLLNHITSIELENLNYTKIIEKNTSDEDVSKLEKQLENHIISVAELKSRKYPLITLLETAQAKNRILVEKKKEIEIISNKIERLEKAILNLLDFNKQKFKEQFKEIWIKIWSEMLNENISKWKIDVTDSLSLSVQTQEGKTYGNKNRNPGSEEDMLSMSYQIALIKTLVHRGWKPRYRIFLLDDPFEGIDIGFHCNIAKTIESLSLDQNFQVIFTSRLDNLASIKENFKNIQIHNITEFTTPYTPRNEKTMEEWIN